MLFTDDVNIVEGLKQGNEVAFDEMFKRYFEILCLHAHSVLEDSEEAKDLVQELFTKLFRYNHIWTNVVDLRGYLFRCIHNSCLNALKKRKVLSERKQLYLSETFAFLKNGQTSENEILRFEENALESINNLLPDLPPQRLAAMNLVYVIGSSYEEAASLMGVSENTIKTHLRLGREYIRAKLLVRLLAIALILQYFDFNHFLPVRYAIG
ncbi:RNA polymerase sigma factor [Chitinophaga niabensis]|uniref:RNA polymerase sigma-70 factor, ECF subfamily n=1 Tax=Chitinophaga niabensis TaxID=536979 RepID=A0A1N6KBL4_9BACT|nr:RNA polymerase sigma factor [Chitinophaga niabensis]SIO53716.1 RNA polymerase sigma-70 factor, ECF subfamily [Chitinophaga niabensis]